MSGRLTKWAIELGEFDIKFMLRTAIKGQAIADFSVEFACPTKALEVATNTPSTLEGHKKGDKPTNSSNVWSLRIDDSSNVNGSGAGIILESPIGEKNNYALILKFRTSNNKAKYEGLLVGLRLAKEIRV